MKIDDLIDQLKTAKASNNLALIVRDDQGNHYAIERVQMGDGGCVIVIKRLSPP